MAESVELSSGILFCCGELWSVTVWSLVPGRCMHAGSWLVPGWTTLSYSSPCYPDWQRHADTPAPTRVRSYAQAEPAACAAPHTPQQLID